MEMIPFQSNTDHQQKNPSTNHSRLDAENISVQPLIQREPYTSEPDLDKIEEPLDFIMTGWEGTSTFHRRLKTISITNYRDG